MDLRRGFRVSDSGDTDMAHLHIAAKSLGHPMS